jgi:glutamate---cysteine ligase / carboxylate-amine ligase
MEFKRSEPLSIGVELEFQLLKAETLDLTDGILPLMEFYPDSPYVKPESIQNTVEIASKVCTSIAELKVHLTALVADLKAKCQALGMRLCGAGTHPFCQRLALITPLPRYLAMEERYGYLAHTQITFATHVHLGVTSGDEAIALMRSLKPYLPLLIALSANSPFWRGYDTGYASYRHRILAATRSYGVPPSFQSWKEFCHFFETTHRAGLFQTLNDIHWDLRPRPHLGTLEVRVMDAQPTIAQAMDLTSFVRVLAAYLLRRADGMLPDLPWWLEKENHFHASHLGLEAGYVANEKGTTRPLAAVWREVLETLRPLAEELGEEAWLERLHRRVEEGLSYAYQRQVYEESGLLRQVVSALIEELERETARRESE